jgi:hypothetical protein
LNEIIQVFFLNLIVTDKMRPQIRQIYNVLRSVFTNRVQQECAPNRDIKFVQHTSAACRAARNSSLDILTSSNILSHLNDNDIAMCRMSRLTRKWDIGYIAYAILYIPALISSHDLLQQTTLDIILPLFLCGLLSVAQLLVTSDIDLDLVEFDRDLGEEPTGDIFSSYAATSQSKSATIRRNNPPMNVKSHYYNDDGSQSDAFDRIHIEPEEEYTINILR